MTATSTTVDAALDLADIQGNILRGYRFPDVRYFTLAITDPAGGRALLDVLLKGTEVIPAVENADEWRDRPTACVNVFFTFPGLAAL
ncbi:MAG: hypothetical protein QOJ74_2252, partial [Ilumatobacteraceae bacterium]|nr:hypothetical protein [Ilumatobacteraceae bacterium]